MTGCVDLVVSEFNCTIPGIEPICEQLDIKMLCLDDVAKKANAQLLPYTAEEKEKITSQIIADALCGGVGYNRDNQRKLQYLCGMCGLNVL